MSRPAATLFLRSVFRVSGVGAFLLAATAWGQQVQVDVVHSFVQRDAGGFQGQLLQATDGDFYVTSPYGGERVDFGEILKIAPDGATTVLHAFSDTDGSWPYAGLLEGPDGNLYGTTWAGGVDGYGTVFRISPQGKFDLLHQFSGADGGHPRTALVVSPSGELYGATEGFGSVGSTIFKMSLDGKFETIYFFNEDGLLATPEGMAFGPDGNLYGVAINGVRPPGCNVDEGSCGGVFKISTDGTKFSARLFRSSEGIGPIGAPIVGSDGNLYGTTVRGGDLEACDGMGCGTVWRYVPNSGLEVIHRFHGYAGWRPWGRLLEASDGNLYGTTSAGGTRGKSRCGAIFQVSPDGSFTTVYRMNGDVGCAAFSGLIESPDHLLYGLAGYGGEFGYGTLFRLSEW